MRSGEQGAGRDGTNDERADERADETVPKNGPGSARIIDLLRGRVGERRQRLTVERRRVPAGVVVGRVERRRRLGLRRAGDRLRAAVGGGNAEAVRSRKNLARVSVADVEVEAVAGRDRSVEVDGERLGLPVDLCRNEQGRVLGKGRRR